jgi:hypothetical protein
VYHRLWSPSGAAGRSDCVHQARLKVKLRKATEYPMVSKA